MSDIYKKFHGHPVREKQEVQWQDPEKLVFLGEAIEIIYRSDKVNGGGDGKPNSFRHKFDKGTMLLTNETGRYLIIVGERLHVTDRGIVN